MTQSDPTDAAVEALANDLANIYRGSPGLMKDRMLVVARHLLTRQPGPEDVERIRLAILALYPAPPESIAARVDVLVAEYQKLERESEARIAELEALENTPARAPTRSALDSALDPMLGNSPVRRAVVDAVLGLFEDARRPVTEADVERITKSATNIRAARDGDYRMWADLSNYVHAERAQFTRDTLTAASWPMTAPMDAVASDRLVWLEKIHSETMDQNLQLIVERDALNARVADLEAELAEKSPPMGAPGYENEATRRLADRFPNHPEAIAGDVSQEFSDLLGHVHPDQDYLSEEAALLCRYAYDIGREEVKPSATPSSGTIRLGEAQERVIRAAEMWVKAQRGVTRYYDYRDELIQAVLALRASATPKPEAVDWEAIGKTYVEGDESAYGLPEIIRGLVDKIAALRAGGV